MAKPLLTRLEKHQFRLTINIPKEKVDEVKQAVIGEVTKGKAVPGFRQGKAPTDKVIDGLSREKLGQQVRGRLINEAYGEALKEQGLKPVMRPKIEVAKDKEGEDWQIRAVACEAPEVVLDNYKEKIKGVLSKGKTKTQSPAVKDKAELPPPQGESWEDKEQKVLDWIIKNVKVELPEILIEDETNLILSRMFNQMMKLGLTAEQYLDSMHWTAEDVRASYRKRAEENLILEFALSEITRDLGVEVKPEEVEKVIEETTDEKLKKALREDPRRRQSLELSMKRRKTIGELVKLAEYNK